MCVPGQKYLGKKMRIRHSKMWYVTTLPKPGTHLGCGRGPLGALQTTSSLRPRVGLGREQRVQPPIDRIGHNPLLLPTPHFSSASPISSVPWTGLTSLPPSLTCSHLSTLSFGHFLPSPLSSRDVSDATSSLRPYLSSSLMFFSHLFIPKYFRANL